MVVISTSSFPILIILTGTTDVSTTRESSTSGDRVIEVNTGPGNQEVAAELSTTLSGEKQNKTKQNIKTKNKQTNNK